MTILLLGVLALLSISLIAILRTDLKKAKKGEKSKFWECDK